MPVMKNIGTLYQCLDEGGQGDVQPIENAALVWQGDTITWVGREAELPGRGIDDPEDDQVHDAGANVRAGPAHRRTGRPSCPTCPNGAN